MSFLANTVQYYTIKVYLSAFCSLHIEQGFPDPLLDCLRLQRVLRGVKRTQGDASSQQLPITDNVMVIIFKALDVNMPDHCMFWPACCLAYFGFLCSAEFTIPNLASFSSSIHLGVADTVVDSASPPSCLRVRIVFKNRSVSEGVFRAHTPRHISTVCTPNLAVIFD